MRMRKKWRWRLTVCRESRPETGLKGSGVILKEGGKQIWYLGWHPIMEDLESWTDGLNLIWQQ